MKSTLLKNCQILVEGKLEKRHLFLEDHKIAHISEEIIAADKVVDIKGKIVIPGLIDSHVHFREPGLTQKEDLESGSRAAVKGGITTVMDMPNTIPAMITVERLEEKRKLAKGMLCNYGFHFGSSLGNIEEIKRVKNVPSVKIYMDNTTGDLRMTDMDAIGHVVEQAAFCTFHAERDNLEKAIEIVTDLKKKMYACHVSLASEVALIKKNKNRVFMEVCPHHLFLTEADNERLEMLQHVKPSLKKQSDQDALWSAIGSGLVDTICSDHAPHLREEKMEKVMFGYPGVETMLPLLLDAVNNGRLSLTKVVELTSTNAAKIFGLKTKGKIEDGYDADLTVISMELTRVVKAENLVSKSGWSPFEGKALKGWPIATYVGGTLVYDGEFHEHPGKEITIERPKERVKEAVVEEEVDEKVPEEESSDVQEDAEEQVEETEEEKAPEGEKNVGELNEQENSTGTQ
ncbi:MAG: dihydroorotase family protein [Nanoarchaeota archaeon]|nr:dihydroorotase family protein [Nanoarchaeota archaeon]